MPNFLEGLDDVDVLHLALDCRFALDIFTVSQHSSSTLELGPVPGDPEPLSILSVVPSFLF